MIMKKALREQGRKPGTKCGGTSCAGGMGTEVPSGVEGRSPGRGSGDEVHQKLKQFWISICIF